MDLNIERAGFLLLIAAVVAMLTRRLRFPYSVGLVIAGIVVALLPFSLQIELTKQLIFTALLPPLIFEASLYLDWAQLRRDFLVVAVLATIGVILSAGITTAGTHGLAHWPWLSSMMFGVLIAATDPVSVIATFKDAHVHGRLRLLVESESIFNDCTAAVAFAIVLDLASGHRLTPLEVTGRLALMMGGSLLCGAIVGGLALALMGRTQDHLVETTFTTIAAYGSFLLAEHLGLSGVLATLTAGLMIGNLGDVAAISERGKEAIQAFWEYAAFVANSLVFLLIGMREAHQNFGAVWPTAAVAILIVILGRAAAIYPCCALFRWSGLRVSVRHQHVLFWGGLRGALALALALALPPDLPQRESIITVTFAVVAFSIFVQGLTVTPLLRALGEIPGRRQAKG
jgi:CPA1 family monovalent cation:H+ antiporter